MVRATRGLAGCIAVVSMVAVVMVTVPAEAARRKCFGQRVTIVATGGDQPVLGTRGPDVILGKGANDVINGRGGDDFICGGGGDDTISGGGGDDKLNGGSDSGFGDTLIGGGGDDLMSGGGAANYETGADAGDYTEYSGNRGVNVNLATGVATGYGNDTMRNIEQAGGTDHDDVLIGNDLHNLFWGNGGNDMIDLGGGSPFGELVWPGLGDDQVTGDPTTRQMVAYDDIPGATGVRIDLPQGTATGAGNDTLTNITDAMGSVGNDTITGTSGPNVIHDCAGNDTVDLGSNPATGSDPAAFINAMGIDIAFDDSCFLGEHSPGNDSYTGGSGVSMACWCSATGNITANLQTGTATGQGTDTLINIKGLIGGPGADTLTGGPNRDYLEGTEANDTLNGGGGDDVMIAFHMSELTVDLGGGTATGYMGASPTLSTYALTSIEDVWGSLDYGDTLIGSNQDNELFGMGGNDNLTGNQGADLLNGGDGTDTGDAGQGNDTCVSIESPTGCETTSAARAARRAAGGVFYGSYSFGGRFLKN